MTSSGTPGTTLPSMYVTSFTQQSPLHNHDGFVVTRSDYVGRRGQDFPICLFVCLFVCLSFCQQHNLKTNEFKVFKLGVVNDLGIPQKWYCFGVQRSMSQDLITLHTITVHFELQSRFVHISRWRYYNVTTALHCTLSFATRLEATLTRVIIL